MTTAHRRGVIPDQPRNLRLELARRHIGASQRDFAEMLGVSNTTVQRAERGDDVRRSTLLAWAMVTGVDLDWLEHGTVPTDGGPNQGEGSTGG
ncbi:helix-turn-helix domain-containing protein [Tsukamurella paurometabola]|uniref:helix-turn-helix domain-containing protein n=1 Tax=Tsukamurella paurometabola TaxID=2061 RepID=UPI000F7E5D10|nr:helix-turn-helix transcriptional regulator [Tsukamurella paurometabola]UEA83118.1 helix-turn-helix domain-containing protein [Tsukamurella paurometabola]